MKNSILKGIAIASIAMAIGSCSHETPVSLRSNSTTMASTGHPGLYQLSSSINSTTGKLTLLAGNTTNGTSSLYYKNQTGNAPSVWGNWTFNSCIFKGEMAACNRNVNGSNRFYTFCIGTNDNVWYTYNLQSGWGDLGASPSGGVYCVKAAQFGTSTSSRIVVFASGWVERCVIWMKYQNADGSFPTNWVQCTGAADGQFNVCTRSDGKILVVYQDPLSHQVNALVVTNPATGASTSYSLGSLITGFDYDIVIGKNADNRMEIFASRGNDLVIFHNWELNANTGNFQGWSSYFGPSGSQLQSGGHLAIGSNYPDNRLELFYRNFSTNYLYHTYQVQASGSWSDAGVFYTGGGIIPTSEISCSRSQDNKLYVFCYTADLKFTYVAQVSPGSGWGAPTTLNDYP